MQWILQQWKMYCDKGETNMSVKISDTLRQHLGWCPQTQEQTRRLTAQSFEHGNAPSDDGGIPLLSFAWYSEVRIQMFILGILMSVFVLWSTPPNIPLLSIAAVIGTIAAIPLAGITILGYQKFFAEVVKQSVGNEMTWCRGRGCSIFLFMLGYGAVIIGFLYGVISGWIPGLDLTFSVGFIPGFIIAYMILYLLYLILWERNAGRRLYMKWPLYYVREEE